MDRNNVTAILLTLIVLLTWTTYRRQVIPPVEEGGVELAENGGDETPEAPVNVPVAEPAPEPVPVATNIPLRELPFDACGATGTWSTEDGALSNLAIPAALAAQDVSPFWSYVLEGLPDGLAGWSPYGGEPGPETVVSKNGGFLTMGAGALTSASPRTEVVDESADSLTLRGVTAEGIEVTRTITNQGGEPCSLKVDMSWTNRGSKPYSGALWLGAHDNMFGSAGYYNSLLRPYAMFDEDVEWFSDHTAFDDEPEQAREGAVSWIGMADRYYGVFLVPSNDSATTVTFNRRAANLADDDSNVGNPEYENLDGVSLVVNKTLQPGTTHTETATLFVGQRTFDNMGGIDEDLGYLVKWEYGWFAVICFPLLWLLKFFYSVLGNWGLAIIALTVSAKGLFFPLTQAGFRSSQAMQAIQPELQRIREEFKDEPQKLNEKTMALFQENGVNPLGGCLPMLVQMPVWFALYRVLLSSTELYHTDFLYLKDLSVTDPYMFLPTIVVIAMVLQQQMMPTAPNMDPAQAKMLKLMPLVFGFFFFTFPAGLVLYIFVNMILTILQQWIIRRQFDLAAEKKVPAAASTP